MTVYVDNVRIRASVGRYRDRSWCHLLTDDPTHAELHEFAARIGLKRSWFQPPKALIPGRPAPWWRGHYDVTEAVRKRAILAGAVDINFVQWAEMVERFKADLPVPGAPGRPENEGQEQGHG